MFGGLEPVRSAKIQLRVRARKLVGWVDTLPIVRHTRSARFPMGMKTLRSVLLAICVAVFGSLATAQAQAPGFQMNDADRTFLQQMAQSAAFEIMGGQLARFRSNAPVIRQLGGRITRANVRESGQIRNLAIRFGVPVTNQPTQVQLEDLQDLQRFVGGQFNRKFVNGQIRTILNEISASLTVIREGLNPLVRGFAGSVWAIAAKPRCRTAAQNSDAVTGRLSAGKLKADHEWGA